MPPFARLALAALLVGGCADTVDPTLGTEQAFSLYGYLDPTADRQAIRVVPVVDALDADTARVLDATVTSVEPATGRTVTWRDSVVTFADGSIGHIFVSDYTPTAGTRVELRVEASDGGQAAVTIETPPLARPSVGEPAAGDPGTYPVTVAGVPRVLGGTLRVYVAGRPGTAGTSVIEIPLPRIEVGEAGGAHTLAVPFLEATRAQLRELGLFRAGLELLEAEFTAFVANEAWARPPGGFDEEAIVEPGTFSNVAGGFGFVGAGYRAPVRWVPSTSVQSLAGFEVTNDPAAQLAINEIGDGYVELYNPTMLPVELEGYVVSTSGLEGGTQFGAGAEIASRGFLVATGAFSATEGAIVQLLTSSGRFLKQAYVNHDAASWGAFPDGYSHRPPQSEIDIFYGPVVASPGVPNRPAEVPAVINEVRVAGAGYVEVLGLTFPLGSLTVASALDLERGRTTPQGSLPFLVAPEGGAFALDPLGGEVYLLASTLVRGSRGDVVPNVQAVDARRYGPQTPDHAEGYLPDGPGGTWTTGLRPTRGAANAAARGGL